MPQERTRSILILLYDYAPTIGGVQTLYREAARHLAPDVAVVCARGPDPRADRDFDEGKPYPIQRLDLRERDLLDRSVYKTAILLGAPWLGFHLVMIRRALPDILRVLRSRQYSCIHCGYHFLAAVALLAARISRLPFHLFVHGNELLKMRDSIFERMLLRSADRVFVLSDYAADSARGLGASPARIRKTRFGVEIPEPSEIREHRESRDRPVILTVTRLEERKGVDTVLEALALLGEAGRRATYVVAGDGSCRKALEAKAEDLGLSSRVRFLGTVGSREKRELLRRCDIFVLVPRLLHEKNQVEGFGIVYLEAGAWGKPVLGSRTGGVPEAVLNGRTGLLVEPDDPEATARALRRLLEDPGLRRRLGEAARSRIEAEFTWEAFVQAVRETAPEPAKQRRTGAAAGSCGGTGLAPPSRTTPRVPGT